MKNILFILTFLCSALATAQTDIVGRWKTIDDATGKPKSIVEIFKDGEVYKGKIVELLNPEKPDPVCEKCTDSRKDQPIIGMELMGGFKETEKGKEWTGGEILDPNNGKIYKCRLRLKDNGEKLEVRGFIGISLFGRSQIWLREN